MPSPVRPISEATPQPRGLHRRRNLFVLTARTFLGIVPGLRDNLLPGGPSIGAEENCRFITKMRAIGRLPNLTYAKEILRLLPDKRTSGPRIDQVHSVRYDGTLPRRHLTMNPKYRSWIPGIVFWVLFAGSVGFAKRFTWLDVFWHGALLLFTLFVTISVVLQIFRKWHVSAGYVYCGVPHWVVRLFGEEEKSK